MRLETERLILREFVPEDWGALHAYQQHPDYLRYYEWTERTPEQVRAFMQMFLDNQTHTPRFKFQLAITRKDTGDLIGNCGVRLTAPGSHEADIGYELAPWEWGKGYATEAARAVLTFGFEQLNVERVWATCVADNIGSAHVLEKLGMTLEGRLRHKAWYKDRWWDHLMYAILRDEFERRE